MEHFYVYLLKNPLKEGAPFYVGKGKGRRVDSHLRDARKGKNTHKFNVIRQIVEAGSKPIVQFVDTELSEEQAFELEVFMISLIGREDTGSGTLTNKTDGGEGGVGYKHTKEAIEKIRLSQIGKTVSEQTKQLISKNSRSMEVWQRPGLLEKISGENHWNFGKPSANKGVKWTTAQKEKQSKLFSGVNHPMFGVPCSETRRAAIKAATVGVKKSTTEKMKKPKATMQCPHCEKIGGTGNMQRWHFSNCKMKVAI